MPPVFAHGRLRLYLLKLLDESPRHGYEVIRLLEERFHGLYAPSAGTVYPRLAKLAAEGLVSQSTEGGRKVYSITDAGRAELDDRRDELAELELEIHESLTALAAEIHEDVRGSVHDLRREMAAAARSSRTEPTAGGGSGGAGGEEGRPWYDQEAWRRAKDEVRKAKRQWQEQAKRAKDESRQARRQAEEAEERARRARQEARDEVLRVARGVQEQVQERAKAGDWQGALREGMAELADQLGSLGRLTGGQQTGEEPRADETRPEGAPPAGAVRMAKEPEWAREPADGPTDPVRELERLLDRFRDDVRDAARDHGVTPEQLREMRRHLSAAAAALTSELHR
ncbi:PadR family transcriptional regulator [Streptomyces alkaliterrae]|uniref:Helix-turn-helix transcriptional regulator n=1 Tax=Streptomyces alkaliterrae TaxID=2213162 RepID=A0A5P0YNG8_9ACTN|nr:PadR family transcriptional regulator [Streptomyces alkaliterrae]MBB1252822.1 helix-turn-helix transcriptional regulator [Streptomyces alkaliterrae]MBB1258624.1 helix-turn-helix transcriptional regulator [Streptomyces alkaliterrae]MQS01785.1 PadR family transcriptional regulator [Streptomyces alkaliterrae]